MMLNSHPQQAQAYRAHFLSEVWSPGFSRPASPQSKRWKVSKSCDDCTPTRLKPGLHTCYLAGARLTAVIILFFTAQTVLAAALPIEKNVEWHAFAAQVERLVEAMDYVGSPLKPDEKKAVETALHAPGSEAAGAKLQEVLDRHCLLGVTINPEMRVKVATGPAKPELVEQGWRLFLIKVVNDSGTTGALRAVSPNAQKLAGSTQEEVPDRWLDLMMFDQQPLGPALSGLKLEYRIAQLYARDAGKREAKISFNVGQGTQDLGFRSEADVLFHIQPAREVTLRVHDENNQPTTAAFVIKDAQGRVHPSQAKRLAPDFALHQEAYRSDGETN